MPFVHKGVFGVQGKYQPAVKLAAFCGTDSGNQVFLWEEFRQKSHQSGSFGNHRVAIFHRRQFAHGIDGEKAGGFGAVFAVRHGDGFIIRTAFFQQPADNPAARIGVGIKRDFFHVGNS